MLTKNQQEHPGMRLSAQGLQQLGEQGRQIYDYIPMSALVTVPELYKQRIYFLVDG